MAEKNPKKPAKETDKGERFVAGPVGIHWERPDGTPIPLNKKPEKKTKK